MVYYTQVDLIFFLVSFCCLLVLGYIYKRLCDSTCSTTLRCSWFRSCSSVLFQPERVLVGNVKTPLHFVYDCPSTGSQISWIVEFELLLTCRTHQNSEISANASFTRSALDWGRLEQLKASFVEFVLC